MSKQSLKPISVLAMMLAVMLQAPAQAGEAEDLRVWELRPAVFDYLFTSVILSNEDKTILTLKHRNGDLVEVPVGGMLGDYKLQSHVVTKQKIYKESIAAEITQETHSIIFGHKDTGEELELVRGKPLETDGSMARLIDSRSREYWLVKEGDVFSIKGRDVKVVSISEIQVNALIEGNVDLIIPLADERDRELYTERVMAYREAVRDIRREQQQQAQAAPAVARIQRPAEKQIVAQAAPAANAEAGAPQAASPVIHNHIHLSDPDRSRSINVLNGGLSPQYLYPPTLVTDGQIFTPVTPYGHQSQTVTTTETTQPARTDIRSIHVKPTTKKTAVTTRTTHTSQPVYGPRRSMHRGGSSFRFSYQDDEFGIRGRF